MLIAAPSQPYEKVYATPDTVIDIHFPTFTSVSSKNIDITGNIKTEIEYELGVTVRNKTATIYTIFQDHSLLGYSVKLDELGKYKPITLMTCISPDLSVINVSILIYREKIGSSVRKKRFLKQFKFKTSEDPLLLNQDIDGITGATVSSWAVATAVKKSLLLIKGIQVETTL
jgi:Na+-translocating ferredoxin:NAD+ oxidoreductase RnfG subunit